MAIRFLLFCCVTSGFQTLSMADDKVYSGPQVGEKLPGFTVALAYGRQRGEKVDVVKQAGDRTVLLVIVNGANRPAARLTRALMNYSEMQDSRKLLSAVVWLDRDRSTADEYLNKAISWWGVSAPVGVSVDGAEGPGNYGLNRKVNLTILLAHQNRVKANFALVQPSLTDAGKIFESLTKLTGGKVPTTAEIVFLSKPTRKLPTAKWTAAPRDPQLRRLICNLLASNNSDEADKAAAQVDKYVTVHPERTQARTNAAAVLLQRPRELGKSPALPHLRRWRNRN